VCRQCQAYNQVTNGGFEQGQLGPWALQSSGAATTVIASGSTADGDGRALVAQIIAGSVTLRQSLIAIRDGTTVFCSAFGGTSVGISAQFTINIDGVPCASALLDTNSGQMGELEQFSGQVTVFGEYHTVEVVLAPSLAPTVLTLDAIQIVPIDGPGYTKECTATGLVPQNCDFRGFSDNFCSCKINS
jgi:hypothetical protein